MTGAADLRQIVAGLGELARVRPGDALRQAELILQQFPRLVPVRCLAARLARKSGDLDRADAHLEAALAEDPTATPAIAEKGSLAATRGEYAVAAGCFRSLIDAGQRKPDFWFNLALAEERRGRFEEAARAYRDSLAAGAPNVAEVHGRLGGVMAAMGDEGARAEFETALGEDAECIEALLGLGMAELAAGRFGDALDRFRACVASRPDCAEAWQQILESKRLANPEDPDLAAVRSLMASPGLPAETREPLGFALGKACDDLALYDEAFAYFRQANELKRRRLPAFDRGKLDRETEALLASGDGPAAGPKRRRVSLVPVFIVGMPRSGTTLVDQIITGHPEARGVGELAFFDAAPPGNDDEIRAAYLERLGASGTRVVTNKYPANFRHIPVIRRIFPEARIVHVVRDPLDTCLSIFFQDFPVGNPYANDLEDITAYYRSYRRVCERWAGRGSGVLEISYESVLSDLEVTTRRMLGYCGLRWYPGCMDFVNNPQPVTTLSRWQVRQPLYTGSVGRWRHYQDHLEPLIRGLGPSTD